MAQWHLELWRFGLRGLAAVLQSEVLDLALEV